MKIRRYTGRNETKVRETITKELGSQAVVLDWQVRRSGFLFGRRQQVEAIVGIREPESALAGGNPDLERLLKLQRDQFMGVRRTLKQLDDRLNGLEGQLRVQGLDKLPGGNRVLDRVHPGWHEQLTELTYELSDGESPSESQWHQALSSLIATCPEPAPRRGGAPAITCLVGPTGVGKTTSLAKLAARSVLMDRLNVGVITLDTFRIGAVDQVREYAQLLGIDVQVAFTPEELNGCLERCRHLDLILVDTPGRSQYDQSSLDAITDFLPPSQALQVALVVPAGVPRSEAAAIAAGFAVTGPDQLILTKLDEASSCDGLTTLLASSGLPVMYLTDGQRVPEDIYAATAAEVAATILRPADLQRRVHQGGAAA